MRLNKAQIDAVVSEVIEKMTAQTNDVIVPPAGKKEWEKIEKKIKEARIMRDKYQELDQKIDDLNEMLDVKRREMNQFDKEVQKTISTFSKKYKIEVNWDAYDDEGEETDKVEFSIDTSGLKERIERQITIMTIDSKKITADELIEKLTNQFVKI